MTENEIATVIVDCAYKLHLKAGAGMLEHVYQSCMVHLLEKRGLQVEVEKPITFSFEGLQIERAFRLDILVEGKVVIEIKSTTGINETHVAQALTYLRCSQLKLALILNFGAPIIKEGIRRVVNKL